MASKQKSNKKHKKGTSKAVVGTGASLAGATPEAPAASGQENAPQDVTIGATTVVTTGIPITGITDIPIRRPFPILLNFNPTINSLSPSGAVVGGSDFTLTVLGSNFGSTSTVTWNQSPRKTTAISGTQLTAAIAAADLATVQNASVQVSNPGATPTAPVLFSNSVTFAVIPDITAIIAQLQAITAIPAALLAELQTYVTIKQSEVDSLTTQVSTDQTTAAGLNSQIANLQTQVAQQQTEINTLQQQLQASKAQSASPFDVAQSFKSVVDQIQQAAQAAGGVQTTVSNMNVQLKSLVSVQPATASAPASASLIFPDPTALPDPQHLSTLSFSFGAIPHLSAPAAPAPTPVTPSSSPTNVVAPTPAPAPNVPSATSATAAPVAEAKVQTPAPAPRPPVTKVTAPKVQPVKSVIAKPAVKSSKSAPVAARAVSAEKQAPASAAKPEVKPASAPVTGITAAPKSADGKKIKPSPAKAAAKSVKPIPAKSTSTPST